MFVHYLALPIALIVAILLIRDLIQQNKKHVRSRIAIILVCVVAYWVSGVAIDWVKKEYQDSRPKQVSKKASSY